MKNNVMCTLFSGQITCFVWTIFKIFCTLQHLFTTCFWWNGIRIWLHCGC